MPTIYVNGTIGDDAFDGSSEAVKGNGVGPKRTARAALESVKCDDCEVKFSDHQPVRFENCTIVLVKSSLWSRLKSWVQHLIVRYLAPKSVIKGCTFEMSPEGWGEGYFRLGFTVDQTEAPK